MQDIRQAGTRTVCQHTRPLTLFIEDRGERIGIADVIRKHAPVAVNLHTVIDLVARSGLPGRNLTGRQIQ